MIDKGLEDLELKVFEYCRDNGLLDLAAIVVGLSGGPDSVCLLTVLDKFKKEGRIRSDLVAVHINHNLRPGACDEDEAFVRSLCGSMGIELFVKSVDVKALSEELGISIEEAGRRARYDYFHEVASELGSGDAVIATAHHADDLAETMMMNLFRGAGLDGLTALKPRQDDIVRPLLCVSKEEITGYLDSRGLRYVTDLTNFEDIGTRNVWRNKIFPYMAEHLSRDPKEALASARKLLASDSDYIDRAADEAYSTYKTDIGPFKALDVSAGSLHEAIFTRLIRRLWKDSFGNMTDFESCNLELASELIVKEQDGFVTLDMPFSRKIWRFGGLAGFCGGDEVGKIAAELASKEGYIISEAEVTLEVRDGICEKIEGTNLIIACRIIENIDDLSYNIHSWICPLDMLSDRGRSLVLTNGAGDLKFTRAGSSCGKRLLDVLADRKVPRPVRRSVLAVASDGVILWLPGVGHAVGFTDALSHERFLRENYEGKYLLVEIKPEDRYDT
ncbi:MAG: tRNA lysidine(34) synthetase TilS [Clostridiales bacterium]|nr:tRNA lysidine(34) synthetase TilS [Clostridiales bacterium]